MQVLTTMNKIHENAIWNKIQKDACGISHNLLVKIDKEKNLPMYFKNLLDKACVFAKLKKERMSIT